MCGGCGSEDHCRNDCPDNLDKGKHPPQKGNAADDEEAAGEEAQANDAQQQDEGGSVWDKDDADCGWRK